MQRIFNKDGFNWWIGVVEDRVDPEKLGRCRVRIYGYHTDNKSLLPTEDLPWAIPIHPITSAASSGVGGTPVGPLTGSWVLGFFLDGEDMQQPAFFGTIGSKTAGLSFKQADTKSQFSNKNDGILRDASGATVTDSAGNPVITGTPEVPGWQLGQTSRQYEIGGRSAGFINVYEDMRGACYGAFELPSFLPKKTNKGDSRPSHKNSPVLSYIQQSKFIKFFEKSSSFNLAGVDLLEPATGEFNNVWSTVSSNSPKQFLDDQIEYIKKSYYDVMLSNLKRLGVDLSLFGPAVQDLVWSVSYLYGPSRTSIFTVPLEGKTKLNDTDIVNLVSQYRVDTADYFFKSKGTNFIARIKARSLQERSALLQLIPG